MDEEFIPVASPDLLSRKPVNVPSDIRGYTLLHRDDAPGPLLDWATWLQAAEVEASMPSVASVAVSKVGRFRRRSMGTE